MMPSPRIDDVSHLSGSFLPERTSAFGEPATGPACRAGLSPQFGPNAGHHLMQPRRAGVISGSLHLIWYRIWLQVAAEPRNPARQAEPALLPVYSHIVWLLIAWLAVVWHNATIADEPNNTVHGRIAAICQNLQLATVKLRCGSDVSSGVVISRDGLILSVAHGLKSSSDASLVLFPNGKTCEGRRVFVDQGADVALLAIDIASLADVEWNTVPVTAMEQSKAGEVVLACGFPARENVVLPPVVRLGQILAVAESELISSCTLTSGDSGGPLVNSRGELIGLHRQIGKGLTSNGDISLTAIRRVLERSGHWKSLTQQNDTSSGTLLLWNDLTPALTPPDFAHRVTVEILGSDADGVSSVRSSGTVLNARQVATKLSEIIPDLNLQCQWENGIQIAARLSRFDRERDLAILELEDLYDAGNEVNASILASGSSSLRAGQIVFAAASPSDIAAAGIISRVRHDESSLPSRFGATIRSENGILRIADLSPNGSAVRAGLRVGDELRQIDATDVASLQNAADLFATRQPGDWLTIGIARVGKSISLRARMQHEPGLKFEKTEFLDGRTGRVSLRRSGFMAVLQHDSTIEPDACGGPLFDFEGHLIAVNIARRARESTLAIPIGDVLKLASGQ